MTRQIYFLSSLSFFTFSSPSTAWPLLSLILLFLVVFCFLLMDDASGIFMDFPDPSIAFASRLSLAMRSSIAFGVAPVCENSEFVHQRWWYIFVCSPGNSFDRDSESYDFAERSIKRISNYIMPCQSHLWHCKMFPHTFRSLSEDHTYSLLDG